MSGERGDGQTASHRRAITGAMRLCPRSIRWIRGVGIPRSTRLVQSWDTAAVSTEITEITQPDDGIDPQSDGDTDVLVYNDITCPSDAESSDLMERLKRSRFARRVRNIVVSITEKSNANGTKGDSKDNGEENAQARTATDAVAVVSHAITTSIEEVHWPSAAFGAVASAVGILLICAVTGRR